MQVTCCLHWYLTYTETKHMIFNTSLEISTWVICKYGTWQTQEWNADTKQYSRTQSISCPGYQAVHYHAASLMLLQHINGCCSTSWFCISHSWHCVESADLHIPDIDLMDARTQQCSKQQVTEKIIVTKLSVLFLLHAQRSTKQSFMDLWLHGLTSWCLWSQSQTTPAWAAAPFHSRTRIFLGAWKVMYVCIHNISNTTATVVFASAYIVWCTRVSCLQQLQRCCTGYCKTIALGWLPCSAVCHPLYPQSF